MDNIDMKIYALTEKYKDTEFKWGVFDCSQFAIESLKTLHNVDIKLHPYTTQKEAFKVFKKMGNTFNAVLKGLGFIEMHPAMAQRGDLVTVQNDDAWGTAIALVVGLHAVCPSNRGLKPVSRDRWVSAWGVSCLR